AATGRGYIAFARSNPAHFRLMFRAELIDRGDADWQAATNDAFAPLEAAMRVLAPAVDEAALRARLSLAWCAVHGFCALRAEGAGRELWTPEARAVATAEAMIALLVTACRP
ncbi:MAG: WHG domain-containing protein, partial [Acetobacteraceae bacterium]|nr:WHG domain-containing protein [Acetobacteraceae bacterium]